MSKGILISKVIYKTLTDDTTLTSMVGSKIYPLLIPDQKKDSVKFPYIVFSRTNLVQSYCKDGCYEDVVDVDVIVCHTNYLSGCEITKKVVDLLDCKGGWCEGIYVNQIKVKNITESTFENVYIQRICFAIKVSNIEPDTQPT